MDQLEPQLRLARAATRSVSTYYNIRRTIPQCDTIGQARIVRGFKSDQVANVTVNNFAKLRIGFKRVSIRECVEGGRVTSAGSTNGSGQTREREPEQASVVGHNTLTSMSRKRQFDDDDEMDAADDGPQPPLPGQQDYVRAFLDLCQTGDHATLSNAIAQTPELVHACDTETHWRPLHAAASAGQLDAARLLIEARSDVAAAVSRTGSTCLHISACNGSAGRQSELAKLLIDAGCPLEARDIEGGTAVRPARQPDCQRCASH